MKGRLKEDDSSVPAPDGPFAYSSSFVAGGQYPLVCRQPRAGGPETVLLDGNVEAKGKAYWDIGGAQHSPDHRLLAYASDDRGSELYTIRIRDLGTGEDFADSIPDTRGGFVWANDSKTLFYVRLDDHHRPLLVYRHVVGTPVEADVLVYEEKDIGFYVALSGTQSSKYIVIDAHTHQTSELYLIDADAPLQAPAHRGAAQIWPRVRCRAPSATGSSSPPTRKGRRISASARPPLLRPRMANWRELIPHRPGCLILDTILYRDHMVRLERENGLPRIVVRRLADGAEHIIAFPEEAYALGISVGLRVRHHDHALRLFLDDDAGGDLRLRHGDARARPCASARRCRAGTTRPTTSRAASMRRRPTARRCPCRSSIARTRRSTARPRSSSTATAPTASPSPRPSRPRACRSSTAASSTPSPTSAAARTRATAGTRTASSTKKVNTFTDFIAAGEYLVAQGLTQRGRIVANGGSAGGMLMGVVANMAPDLFLGIIADVPFVDVLNTMLDKDLPLTPPEWPEWGNPIESKEDFDTIRHYSPYENVEAKAYPHIFAYGGLTDPRVTYWEPAKWIARLREKNTSDNLVLLKINMAAGHGGASGRYEQLQEIAADYAFSLKIAGKAGTDVSKQDEEVA